MTEIGLGLKLNVYGLYNTPKDGALYTVKASIANLSFYFNEVDWEFSNSKIFKFQTKDIVVQQLELNQNSCVVFEVAKFTTFTGWVNFAYTVMPITERFLG